MATTNTAIAPWGSRKEVREIDDRIKTMLPGGQKLSQQERLALAQASLMHGLDPFNGEIWMIPRVGMMIGIKGLRKKAHEQIKEKGNYWVDFSEITDPDMRQRYGIPDGALAFEARLFDSENIRTYTDAVAALTKAGIPWETVQGMVGSKPYTIGIGVLKAGESTRMERVQCAMKRAEADATKRRFDVPFGIEINVEEDEARGAGWAVDESQIIDQAGDFDAHEPEEVELLQPAICTCKHTIEEHGIKGMCEAHNCGCKKFTDARLAHGKKALGRDNGGID